MNINIVLPCIATNPVGGFIILYEYANLLEKKGHNVVFHYLLGNTVSWPACTRSIRKIIFSIYLRLFPYIGWFNLDKRIKNRLFMPNRINNSEILIATAIETAETVRNLSASCGKKVYFIQGFENWDFSNDEIYRSYNLGFTNIVVANWLKEVVEEHSGKPAFLVSNGINTDVFNNRGKERKRHSIVLHYRSAEYKGPQYAINAIEKLEYLYDDLSVDVISTEDRPEYLPKSCMFHHALSAVEIAEINNCTEVFMSTSIEEGFGLPGLEAMACGCAVASTSYKGVLEYAVDGYNALLSPASDVDAMVDNIVRLFEDRELRNKIAENGVKTGKEKSIEKSAEEFERILLEAESK